MGNCGPAVRNTEGDKEELLILWLADQVYDVIQGEDMADEALGNQKTIELMIEGIKYEQIATSVYEMKLFEDNELEIYVDKFTHIVTAPDKTIYENLIPLQSDIESEFANDCESSDNLQFYFKLPFWFTIKTPIGNYNPDWAVVFKDKKKIYFVAETKVPDKN